ncbi:29028_t:CDS:1, partial [Gigaspora margarita]
RSLNKRAAGQYLAKYLSKSFHLRSLYAEHGLTDNHRAYHFYQNLYDYEQRAVSLDGKSKFDQLSGTKLNGNQHIFRHFNYETQAISYHYKTNKKLVGKRSQPVLIKKNYRLGTRSLNPLSLLSLASKATKKEAYLFQKPKRQLNQDFQEFLITRLLFLCSKAEFTHIPLEQDHVLKEN